MDEVLAEAIKEAIETVTQATGLSIEKLFGEHVIDMSTLPSEAAFAAGVIEGAGVACGLTALELFEELGIAVA